MAARNQRFRSFIGLGYYDTITPSVILRNVFENPGWYTPYTPYQAEIAQGRLESLLNFQTMVSRPDGDGGGERVAARRGDGGGRSDDAAASRARSGARRRSTQRVLRRRDACFPQTLDVLRGRAEPLGIDLHRRADPSVGDVRAPTCSARYVQYPMTTARCVDLRRSSSARTSAACSSRSAPICWRSRCSTPPGEMGADVVVGNSQRFGVPLGYGGPHAAFFATREAFVRQVPGRIIGVSVDAHGQHGVPHGAADARAAHPAREGDVEHLHRAGAAGEHGGDVRACITARRADARSRARVHALATALEHALADARAIDSRTTRTSTRCASRCRTASRDVGRRQGAPSAPGSTSATSTTARSASRSTRRSTLDDVQAIVRRVRGRRQEGRRRVIDRRRAVPRDLPAGARRERRRS